LKTIYLIRHTTPDVEKGICYGSSDLPVAQSFTDEADTILQKLDGFVPHAVFTSPLQRCTVLAQHLFPSHNHVVDGRLQELDFGDWEMTPWESIDSEVLANWSESFWTTSTPNGESFETLHQRVMDIWHQNIVSHNHQTLAVVCHSGVMRAVIMRVLGIPHTKIYNLNLEYGAVVKVTWTDDNNHRLHFM
jgi:alpha-ribazole phosphatase